MTALVVVDNPRRWPLDIPGTEVVAARDYLTDPAHGRGRNTVINLCRSYRYQKTGYYVSLLAAARGHRPLPSVETIQDLRLAALVRLAGHELDRRIQRSLAPLRSDRFELSIYFGGNVAARHDGLARALFNLFPAPLLRATFRHAEGRWTIDGIRIIGAADVPDAHQAFLVDRARRYLVRPPRRRGRTRAARYDLAILHDPAEAIPPSDPSALRRFVDAADRLGIAADLVERDDYGRIAEYDALFIRTTTYVNHYTYRFARRAAAEGLVVIDDPTSIVRCTNKVFLHEALGRHRLPTPRTVVFARENSSLVGDRIGFPCVLKQPDSSFSAGVVRCDDAADFDDRVARLFEDTDLLLAQEFVPTDFDWRIGVLDGAPLFACRYFMARGHWQIMKHDGDGGVQEGRWETIPVADAPSDVVDLGIRAAALVGDGLYGVDLKIVKGRPVVIEVNDNPSLDAGVEDEILGPRLYERVMRHFLDRLEARGR